MARVQRNHAIPSLSTAAGRRSRGLTLIELMLVVGLVSVLAFIAFPYYTSHQDKIRTSTAIRDITMISLAIQNHRLDHGAYPDSLADVNLTGTKDPWGRAYVYYNVEAEGRGHARKDRALNPINTDFDLYSLGPDGVTKKQVSQKDSADDVIRGRNGGYVGIAADF